MTASSTIPGAGTRERENLGAAALYFLKKMVSDDWKPLPGDPAMKTRLHGLGLIERGWATGIFGMYRRTEAGRLALAQQEATR